MLSYIGCDGDDVLTLRLSAQEQELRAKRAFYISECYAVEGKWSDSSDMLTLTDELLSTGNCN